MFKIKALYHLDLLTLETMYYLEALKVRYFKDKNGKNVLFLEITEVLLTHFNIVNYDYQQNFRVLYIFVPNKAFGKFLDNSLKKFIFLKTFDSEFSCIEVWFTGQNSEPLEIEYKISITFVIN